MDGEYEPSLPGNRGIFSSGQPLDHEPSLGQVPVGPPATPPDSWGPPPNHYNGLPQNPHFMGRQSPNITTMGQGPMGPNDVIIPVDHHGNRCMHPDMADGDSHYQDYLPPATSHNHVEVFWWRHIGGWWAILKDRGNLLPTPKHLYIYRTSSVSEFCPSGKTILYIVFKSRRECSKSYQPPSR